MDNDILIDLKEKNTLSFSQKLSFINLNEVLEKAFNEHSDFVLNTMESSIDKITSLTPSMICWTYYSSLEHGVYSKTKEYVKKEIKNNPVVRELIFLKLI